MTARAKSPPWCCGLVFDSTDGHGAFLPPELAIATMAERDQTMRRHGKLGKTLIWQCTTFDGFGDAWYENARLETACTRANERLTASGAACAGRPVQTLLARVVKQLNQLPSKRFGEVADEFVVFAFDRNEKTTALVPASLTAAKRGKLKTLGLL